MFVNKIKAKVGTETGNKQSEREREKQTKVLREPRDIMKQMNKHTKREVSYESSDCVFS